MLIYKTYCLFMKKDSYSRKIAAYLEKTAAYLTQTAEQGNCLISKKLAKHQVPCFRNSNSYS